MLSAIGLASEFTILENNAMQSIATAAGYMTAPDDLVAGGLHDGDKPDHPAAHHVGLDRGHRDPGSPVRVSLKRRFINDEQHPFPEGRAAGIVMDALAHLGRTGLLKAKRWASGPSPRWLSCSSTAHPRTRQAR